MKTKKTGKMIAGALAAVMMMTSAASLAASADFIFARNDTILTYDEFTNCLTAESSGDFYNGHQIIETTYCYDTTDYKFMYSDGIFEDDPVQYSEHMATLACSIGHASCTYVENGSYENGAQNIKALLENAGFTDIYESETYRQKPTDDSVACVIASKTVHTKDGDKKVVAIAVRSGDYEKEWASNVKLGILGEAEGFSNAADQVVGKAGFALDFENDEGKCYLRDYFEKYGKEDLENGNVIFWLNGYSRGGATANLSAKRLIDATQNSTNSGVASEEKPGSDYRTIHNVINEDDFVTYVAPSNMGFKRYGVDHYVQRGKADSDNLLGPAEMTRLNSSFPNNSSDNYNSVLDLNRQIKRMKWQGLEMCGQDSETAAKYIPYKYTMYKFFIEDPTNIRVDSNSQTTAHFIRSFMDNLTAKDEYHEDGITREKYATTIQSGISELMSYMQNFEKIPSPEISKTGLILSALNAILKENSGNYTVIDNSRPGYITVKASVGVKIDITHEIIDQLKSDKNFMKMLENYPVGSEQAFRDISSLIMNILSNKLYVNDIITLSENADGIAQNHEFITTSAWLRSFDDW